MPLVSLFGPTVYVYSRQAWQHAKAFYFVARLLICSRPFQSESSSVTEGGSGKKKKCGFLWPRVTANRDKLLAAEFEGALLEIWSSIVDCVLSLSKNINYPFLTLWAMQTQTNGRLLPSWLWSLVSYIPKSILRYLSILSLNQVDLCLSTF